tara:strand:- start:1288 stop:1809 length:522 start_codon:yes stop_codon:yes gene_type:complete
MAIHYGDGTTSNNGRIIQVLQAHKSGTTTYSGGQTWSGNIGGLTQSITMSDSNNKVLAFWMVCVSARSGVYSAQTRFVRGGTVLGAGGVHNTDQVASSNHYYTSHDSYSDRTFSNMGNGFLDSPGSGTHTYAIQIRGGYNSNNVYINRLFSNDAWSHIGSASSFLTLMEVSHS